MKKKDVCRRMGAALLALLLCVSTVPALAADGPTFSDVDPNHWSYPYVEWAAERGFVKGVGEGRFNPNGTVTRAQFVTMIGRALDWEYETLEGDTWYDGYVRYANERGYFTNANDLDHSRHNNVETDKTSLNAGMPREEMALLTANTQLRNIKLLRDDATLFTDALNTGNRWHVVWCYERNIISGYTDGAFKGQNTITRAEACKVLKQIVEYYELHKDEREGLPTTTDVPQWHWCYDYLDWAWKEGLIQEFDSSEGEGKLMAVLNNTSSEDVVTREYAVRTLNKYLKGCSVSQSDIQSSSAYRPDKAAAQDIINVIAKCVTENNTTLGNFEAYYWAMENGYYSEHNSDSCQWGSYRGLVEEAEEAAKHGGYNGKEPITVGDYIYLLYHLADHFDLVTPEDKIIEKDTRRNMLPLGVDTSAWINEPIKNLSQEQVELAVQSELARMIVEYFEQENGSTLTERKDRSIYNIRRAFYYWQYKKQGIGSAHGNPKGVRIDMELWGINRGDGSEIATLVLASTSKTPTKLAQDALNAWKKSEAHNTLLLGREMDNSTPTVFGCGVMRIGSYLSCIVDVGEYLYE